MAIHGERPGGHRVGRWTPRNKTILSRGERSLAPTIQRLSADYLMNDVGWLYLRHRRIVSYYILLVHGERPGGHGVGVEAMVDRLLAGLSELASSIFVAQQGGKLVG